jgi:5-hydroxyisourate hydrolase
MNRLSTHILDTSVGKPAAGVPVRLFAAGREISFNITDSDGRCPNLLPSGITLPAGICRIVFDIATYLPSGLYPEIAITFNVNAESPHYHIPLLLSPFGYTTYRGS